VHGQVEIWNDVFDVRTLHGEIVPKVLLPLMLSVEPRIPSPQVDGAACVPSGSAHARLDARDRFGARLGVLPDHPFFTALR
jgi:hypothetical protein